MSAHEMFRDLETLANGLGLKLGISRVAEHYTMLTLWHTPSCVSVELSDDACGRFLRLLTDMRATNQLHVAITQDTYDERYELYVGMANACGLQLDIQESEAFGRFVVLSNSSVKHTCCVCEGQGLELVVFLNVWRLCDQLHFAVAQIENLKARIAELEKCPD